MQETITQQPLLMKGWVATFFVNKGGRKVGPYYTRNWKHQGKLYKEYIKQSDVQKIREACQANRERRKKQRALAHNLRSTIENINFVARLAKRSETQQLREEDLAHVEKLEREGYAAGGRPCLRTNIAARPVRSGHLPTNNWAIENRQPSNVMVPSLTKSIDRIMRLESRFLQRALQAFKSVRKAERVQETNEEKWARWRKEIASQPAPERPYKLALPDWITEQEMDELVAEACKPKPRTEQP